MKELTIEQKAQRYDEAVKRAEIEKEKSRNLGLLEFIDENFPELKESEESEDEKIRKWLIALIKSNEYGSISNIGKMPCPKLNVLTWLEKQGEQKYTNSYCQENCKGFKETGKCFADGDCKAKREAESIDKINPKFKIGDTIVEKDLDECGYGTIKDIKDGQYIFTDGSAMNINEQGGWQLVKTFTNIEQKSDDKVKPKFKVGDWVVWDNKISCHVDKIYQGKESLMYTITDTNNMTRSYSVKGFDNNAHLWTIQDTKDGDVLAAHECLVLFKEIDGLNIKCYCTYHNMGSNPSFYVDTLQNKTAFYPATKEQRDLLFQKMREAGYTFDFKKKELKKIESYNLRSIIKNEPSPAIKKVVDSLTAWSEEDDIMVHDIDNALRCQITYPISRLQSMSAWIDNLKNRVQPQQKWSEEDDKQLEIAIQCTFTHGFLSTVNWLKFLKERVQLKSEWKQENTGDLTNFENAMMHIGNSFFGQHAGLDPNDTSAIKEQANLLLKLIPSKKWSEEDERNLNDAILFIETGTYSLDKDNLINWLKSLRPQNNITDEELAQAKKNAYNDALDKIEYHSGELTFDDGWSAVQYGI